MSMINWSMKGVVMQLSRLAPENGKPPILNHTLWGTSKSSSLVHVCHSRPNLGTSVLEPNPDQATEKR